MELKNGTEHETTCKLKSLIGEPGVCIEGIGLLVDAAMIMLEWRLGALCIPVSAAT